MKVKPCPWCGQIPKIESFSYSIRNSGRVTEWSIECIGTTTRNWCSVRPRLTGIGDRDSAIKIWNSYDKER